MITVGMHDAQRATAEVAESGTCAWIDISGKSGDMISIFVEPGDIEAARTLVEYFNNNVARNRPREEPADATD